MLVARAERWLRNTRHCGVVLLERACGGTSEIPDAIGWSRAYWSILVECKTSRADFLRDRRKHFRGAEGSFGGSRGMGQRRFYLTPPGLVRVDELPAGWGLVEVHGNKCRVMKEADEKGFDVERCRYELALLYSFARRAQLGVEPTVGCLEAEADNPYPENEDL